MNFDFLLPQCGNNDNNIGNYHGLEFENPKPFINNSCNHDKTNEQIGKRNFTCKMPPVYDPRPELTGLCIDGQKEREQIKTESTEDMLGDKLVSCTPPLCPGKMDARRYFLNVDVESRLKNIDYLTTKCKEHIYKLDADCKDCQLSCYRNVLKKDTDVPYPERPRAECLEGHQFPDKTNIKDNPYVFIREKQDTVYDFTHHKVCNIGSERVWNNPTKRSMKEPEQCKFK